MIRNAGLAVFLVLATIASPARAWHEVGHILTVFVAYNQLSPGEKPSEAIKRLLAILKHHPRFQQDFAEAMPKGLSEDAQARWILARASVWPDQIRVDHDNRPSYPPQAEKQGSYSRGNWHYIDTPLVISANVNDATAKALLAKAKSEQQLSPEPPAKEADVKNVLQAIAFNRDRVQHGTPEEQAVALCWLLHTVSDIHQPLHATAAFSAHAFDPERKHHGDEGGNGIRLADKRNLHALWDAAPDAAPDPTYDPNEPFDRRYGRAYDRAVKQIVPLLADEQLVAQGKQAAQEKDSQKWAQESYELAQTKVYTDDVRRAILGADSDSESHGRVTAKLPESYRAQAHEIGKLRVMQAGYRLAEILKDLGKSQ